MRAESVSCVAKRANEIEQIPLSIHTKIQSFRILSILDIHRFLWIDIFALREILLVFLIRRFFQNEFSRVFFLRIHQPWFTIRSPTLRSRLRFPIRRKLARKSGYIYWILFNCSILWCVSFDWWIVATETCWFFLFGKTGSSSCFLLRSNLFFFNVEGE